MKHLAILTAATLLAGCSTLSSLNPFGGDSNEEIRERQGEVEGERISILSLTDNLEVGGSLAPGELPLPEGYINQDWPQVGGNAAHVMGHTLGSPTLARAWKEDVGDGSDRKGRVVAPPVIADGRIYVMDADNTVRALSEQSGDEIFRIKVEKQKVERTRTAGTRLEDRIRNPFSLLGSKSGRDKNSVGGGVGIGDSKLFVSSGLGLMGAYDPQTGALLWETPTRTPLHSAPTYADGRVFAISDDNEIFAFNANTGEIIWTYQGIIEPARMLTTPAPAVDGEVVIAPFASGELVALRVQNGGVVWQDSLTSSGQLTPLASINDIASGPVVADGFVLASAQSGNTTAFDIRTGSRIWTQPAGMLGFPLVVGDVVYGVTVNGEVVAMSKIDGSVSWLTQLEAFGNPKKRKDRISWIGPVIAGGKLVVASSEGRLVTVDAQTGTLESEVKVGDPVFVPPVIANQTVYLLTDKAELVAFR